MADTLNQEVAIPAGKVKLEGILTLPDNIRSAVIFVHGSGSSRLSPRNTFVASLLNNAGIGTLLFDLLTPEEDRIYGNRFDIDLLTERLRAATLWFNKQPRTEELPIGYFGASTGTAAALRAAADLGPAVDAVVSRGGRPDLAEQALQRVQAPVLLIVGGNDDLVIELNQRAFRMIRAEKDLRIVPRATHLFEEPGALEEVARLATMWFSRHLVSSAQLRKRAS
jgi:putative phosphoribosyl transferase